MTIDQPVQLDVVIILAEWINENFGNFQPADVEAELEGKLALCSFDQNVFRIPSMLTCKAVKSGKYKSGSSYFVPLVPGTTCGTICRPIKAAIK